MNDFTEDDLWQREMRDRILVPHFYKRLFGDRFQIITDREEQLRGIDTIVEGKEGTLRIDEKIVRWPGYRYAAFSLETRSCTLPGRERPGWMFDSAADRLFYCFEWETSAGQVLSCWWLDFPALQKWFWPIEETFPKFQMETRNRTAGRVVPIVEVRKAINWKHFQLNGEIGG